MLDLGIKRIGELAIIECNGRIVRSEAAFKLRKAVLCRSPCVTGCNSLVRFEHSRLPRCMKSGPS
jgi:hypothetical protein